MATVARPERDERPTPDQTEPATVPDAREEQERRPWLKPLVLYGLLLLGLVALIGPFVWMALGSVKTQQELLQVPPTWLPEDPTLGNYDRLFNRLDFPRYFFNSSVVAAAITLANLLFCSMLGYAFAKLHFAGSRPLFLVVMATLMVPSTVVLVPLFVLMTKLGLVNTHLGLILPTAAGPFGVFLMRQFMSGIPDELLEAARVDGASEWRLYWQIALPLAGPALATLGILTFMQAWNAFLWPLVAATDEQMYTLPVALAVFARGQHAADYGLLMAGSLVVVLPVLIVFVALQRYFTQGISMTGTKG